MSDDARAVAELASLSDLSKALGVLHYLYVSDRGAASEIAAQLRQRGFRTEERMGGDGVAWLVLARHEIALSAKHMASLRQSMEKLVAPWGGEYDGWEADAQHHQ